MTATQLARALEKWPPLIKLHAGQLAFRLRCDTPADLARAFAVLRTGVAALELGRPWYGCDGAAGRSLVLSPADRIPEGVTLLSVGGCSKWDRLHWAARHDSTELFVLPAPAKSGRRGAA